MLNVLEIEEIFHYSTENKDNDKDKKEKNDRRIETICMKVPEVRHAIYESMKGVIASIQIVNEKYSLKLTEENISDSVKELKALDKIISNSRIDLDTKATVIKSFDFKEYKKLLHTCKFTGLKSISRLNNMKVLSDKYLHGSINKTHYFDDLKVQIKFFKELISKYENISIDNCYVYILRYDLKTIKKKNPRSLSRK